MNQNKPKYGPQKDMIYNKLALGLAYNYLSDASKEDQNKVYAIMPDGRHLSLKEAISVVRTCAEML